MLAELKRLLRDYGLEWFSRYYGTYRAIVSDVDDPEMLGRLKLSIPGIHDDVHDYWAWPVGMMAGKDYGMFMLPEPGDAVWVKFENGMAQYPIWMNGWWGEGETPDYAKEDYKKSFLLRLRTGYTLFFSDAKGLIRLEHKNGLKLEMDSFGVSIDRAGKKISLGAVGGSSEPAVLGDKNGDQLEAILDHTKDLTQLLIQLIPAFMPMPGTGAPLIASITPQLSALVAQITATKAQVPQTKSTNVTLD